MTREQLLALLRDAAEFIHHDEWCPVMDHWSVGAQCLCGMRELMVRVEDALATERTETNDLPRREMKVVNTGKDDGDDDGN